MSEEKSLTVVNEQRLTPDAWNMIKEIAPAMQASRYFNVPSPEAAMAIMLKGYELGLPLTASFEFIHVINGKPGLSPRGALALVQQSPNFAEMTIIDEKNKCTVWMKRKNGFEYEISYTLEEAKKADLVKKDSGWEKYQANMLRWRAVGYCSDVVFPDVIGGMKRADELGAEITPEGDVWIVEAESVELPQHDPQEPIKEAHVPFDIPQYNVTELSQLLEVAKDSDGDIREIFKKEFPDSDLEFPTTPREINLVVHRLEEKGVLVVDENGDVTQSEVKENEPT